jgi:uncharacterized membrane protein
MSDSTPLPSDDAAILAVSDGTYTLLVADFSDIDDAWSAYEALKGAEDGVTVKIEGAVVVRRTEDGSVHVQEPTDHSTRRGLAWGAVGGALLGVFFPPAVLGSAAVLGAGGAAIGGLRERNRRKGLETQLSSALVIGHSGLVALVSDPGAVRIRQALARAEWIVQSAVDETLARDLAAVAADTKAHEGKDGDAEQKS